MVRIDFLLIVCLCAPKTLGHAAFKTLGGRFKEVSCVSCDRQSGNGSLVSTFSEETP